MQGGRRLTVLKSGFSGHRRWRCRRPHTSFVTMLTTQVQSSGKGAGSSSIQENISSGADQSPGCTQGRSEKGAQDLPGPPLPPSCRRSRHTCSRDRRHGDCHPFRIPVQVLKVTEVYPSIPAPTPSVHSQDAGNCLCLKSPWERSQLRQRGREAGRN